jgi:hypothetical protein
LPVDDRVPLIVGLEQRCAGIDLDLQPLRQHGLVPAEIPLPAIWLGFRTRRPPADRAARAGACTRTW